MYLLFFYNPLVKSRMYASTKNSCASPLPFLQIKKRRCFHSGASKKSNKLCCIFSWIK